MRPNNPDGTRPRASWRTPPSRQRPLGVRRSSPLRSARDGRSRTRRASFCERDVATERGGRREENAAPPPVRFGTARGISSARAGGHRSPRAAPAVSSAASTLFRNWCQFFSTVLRRPRPDPEHRRGCVGCGTRPRLRGSRPASPHALSLLFLRRTRAARSSASKPLLTHDSRWHKISTPDAPRSCASRDRRAAAPRLRGEAVGAWRGTASPAGSEATEGIDRSRGSRSLFVH